MKTQPRHVTATLNYHLPPAEGGATVFMAGTVGEKRRKMKPTTVEITDMRGIEQDFHLDKQGFQVVKRPTAVTLFDDDERIKSVYYPDCIDLIKKTTGASEVEIYSHVVRRRRWQEVFDAEKDLPDDARSIDRSTANFVHVDHSYTGAWNKAETLTPGWATKIGTRRWAIINLWRPITHPVTRSALAICDARSIPESDLQELPAIFPSTSVASPGLKDPYGGVSTNSHWELKQPGQRGQHKWYYCSDLTPDEAILLKIFDSAEDGVARRAPHTGFVCEEDHGPERESIEVRCLVVWE